jgi:hypothetical protein
MEGTVEKLLATKVGRTAKRFNLNMSAEAYADMDDLAKLSGGRTMSEVFRLALSVFKAIYPAILRGEELFLVDPKTNSERQIIVPK